ncbi:BLUF domain-containing protein [Pedobacter hartonius]|nr:BLUF domain-containing protein [Pedobacter hartonius]
MEYYLIYASKSAHLMLNEELLLILEQSRKWNSDHGITGMLIYIEGLFVALAERQLSAELSGRFMQVLEGSKLEVERIFNFIQTDPRHNDLIILDKGELSARNFESWTMGFKSFTIDEYENTPGYFNLDDSFLQEQAGQDSNIPLYFLKSYYQRGKAQSTFLSK